MGAGTVERGEPLAAWNKICQLISTFMGKGEVSHVSASFDASRIQTQVTAPQRVTSTQSYDAPELSSGAVTK